MSKSYFVKYGDFGNQYSLRWADTDAGCSEAEQRGYERITRKHAIELCREERQRRIYDSSFSGYADTLVYPISHNPYDPDCDLESVDASGYIITA